LRFCFTEIGALRVDINSVRSGNKGLESNLVIVQADDSIWRWWRTKRAANQCLVSIQCVRGLNLKLSLPKS
jgi:hypothetical protein